MVSVASASGRMEIGSLEEHILEKISVAPFGVGIGGSRHSRSHSQGISSPNPNDFYIWWSVSVHALVVSGRSSDQVDSRTARLYSVSVSQDTRHVYFPLP